MVKETLRKKIKTALAIFLKKLEELVEGGYLSPRVWGGLLILGLVGLIIFVQYRPDLSSNASGVEQWSALEGTPQPSVASIGFGSLNDSTPTPAAEVASLESAPTPTVEGSLLPTATPPFTLHTVQEGETLISIAALYDMSTETLLATNDIRDPDALKPDQHLIIPPPEGIRVPIINHEIQ
jgi:LysM repeat protein